MTLPSKREGGFVATFFGHCDLDQLCGWYGLCLCLLKWFIQSIACPWSALVPSGLCSTGKQWPCHDYSRLVKCSNSKSNLTFCCCLIANPLKVWVNLHVRAFAAVAFPRLWAAAGEIPHLFIDACKVSKTLEPMTLLRLCGRGGLSRQKIGMGHCDLTVLPRSTCCMPPVTETWAVWGRSRCLHSPTSQARNRQWLLGDACLHLGTSQDEGRLLPSCWSHRLGM